MEICSTSIVVGAQAGEKADLHPKSRFCNCAFGKTLFQEWEATGGEEVLAHHMSHKGLSK